MSTKYSNISLTVKQSVVSNLLVLQNSSKSHSSLERRNTCSIENVAWNTSFSWSNQFLLTFDWWKILEKWDIFYLFTLEIDFNEFREV